MSESTLVMDNINNLNTLFAQLLTSDFNIEENERAKLLLHSLPNSYDQFIINIIVSRLTFDDVSRTIPKEESKQKNKKDRQENSKHAKALMMTKVDQCNVTLMGVKIMADQSLEEERTSNTIIVAGDDT